MLIRTRRGLEFTLDEIREAEIFCELAGTSDESLAEKREVSLELFKYYQYTNHEKALKFSILATGSTIPKTFQFRFSDAFNWYNVLRVFVSYTNKLLGIFKKAFLPLWYPLAGLLYFLQVPVAHKEGDKDSRAYWSMWALFNCIGCLLLFGVITASGGGLAIATVVSSLYPYVFDVQYEVYKYKTERKSHENLLFKLTQHRGEESELVQNLKNTIYLMKKKRKESFLINAVVMVGGLLFGLSIFIPPFFIGWNAIGATLMLSAFIYLVVKKLHHSWTSPTGFLNHFVHQPLALFLKNPTFYLKNYLYQPIYHLFVKPVQVSAKNDLRILIPPRDQPAITLISPSINSPTLIPIDATNSPSVSPLTSLDIAESTTLIENKLQEADTFIEGVAMLTPAEQKNLRLLLKTPNTQAWNEVIKTYVKKYEEEKKGNLYHCSLKRTVEICRNFYRAFARKEKEKNPETLKFINKEIRFLTRLKDNKFNGDKNTDLSLVHLDEEELIKIFHTQDIDSYRLKIINRLVTLLGIKTQEDYQNQYKSWEHYYEKEQRVKTPFFDTPGFTYGKCGLEIEKNYEEPLKLSHSLTA